jgi:hypothetical protein
VVSIENKLAFLILAYRSPGLLGQLVDSIALGGQRALVHVDAEQDIEKFTVETSLHADFVTQRFSCPWGTWGRVAASIGLIREALREPVTHVALISEDSFFLFHPSEIERRLPKSDRKLFLEVEAMGGASKPLSRISRTSPLRGDPRKQSLFLKAINQLVLLANPRDWQTELGQMTPYAGDSWWILSRRAAQEVVDVVDAQPDVVKFFETTWIADEHFFQTILANSQSGYSFAGTPMYADWESKVGEYPPYFIRDLEDQALLASRTNRMFARKLENATPSFPEDLNEVWKLPVA